MNQYNTPFGLLKTSLRIEKNRINAVLRALDWCDTILASTLWTPISVKNNISLQRNINGQTIEIFPLEAARMDFGMKSRFNKDHLPIELNNQNACVRPAYPRSGPLHTDMIASMMLFLGRAEINSSAVPRTLHSILTEEQIASLPPLPPPRAAYVPGQPSSSGREFLPETRILELTRQHPNSVFSIQFEKRDGTLRNMTARIGVWKDSSGNEKNTQQVSEERSYDLAEYNLKMVFDVEKANYRTVATDRVTRISLGGQTFQAESAQ